MFETMNEGFHFSRAGLGSRVLNGGCAAKGGLRCLEPSIGCRRFPFEQLLSLADDPRRPDEAV